MGFWDTALMVASPGYAIGRALGLNSIETKKGQQQAGDLAVGMAFTPYLAWRAFGGASVFGGEQPEVKTNNPPPKEPPKEKDEKPKAKEGERPRDPGQPKLEEAA